MTLSKKKREVLRMKFGGKCAYCGCDLNGRWQADHVEPVRRIFKWVRRPDGVTSTMVPTGEMERPENDREENLVPACGPCNNDKHAMSLADWRRRLEDLLGVCQRNHSAYRHALRFGLVKPQAQPVIFYFERLDMENAVVRDGPLGGRSL
jgi:5-methylcytosine-specific restriction endonuclease McrA